MSLPFPAQTSHTGFSFQALRSRAGARFIMLGLASITILYYVVAPDPYRPDLAWAHERPLNAAPPPAWDPEFDPPPGGIAHSADPAMRERADAVRTAFRHSYGGYARAAWGYDELLPTSNRSTNNFNGWGVTVIDSISTIQLMQLKPEYDSALDFVSRMTFDISGNGHAPFFETAIRYLGGLVSAHSLATSPVIGPLNAGSSGRERILLEKAALLADKMLPVFNSPSGLPYYGVRTSGPAPAYDDDDPRKYRYAKSSDNAPGARITGTGAAPLAEIASCQIELKYLSWATGKARYFTAAEGVMNVLKRAAPSLRFPGLFPTWWDRVSGNPTGSHVSLGAMADSGFEYLLKQYLVSGKTETRLRDLWLASSDSIISHMLYIAPSRNLLYVTDINGAMPSGKLEHLSCFLPGLFALGADQLTESEGMTKQRKERYMWAAMGLGRTCAGVYEDMESGLGAETVQFPSSSPKWIDELEKWERTRRPGDLPPGVSQQFERVGAGGNRGYYVSDARWLSRPETLESVFLLWRTTKDPVWRERGWKMFQAIEKYSRTSSGYGSVSHVDSGAASATNSQPSYFLAETLKYLYLLFSEDSLLPLDKFIFNTEAHPVGVWKWKDWEMQKYKIE